MLKIEVNLQTLNDDGTLFAFGGIMAKRILIVDDEIDLVDALATHLESDGFEVIKALDGKEGYEKASANRPDLIILDLRMPRMDGFQVCRLLKFDDDLKSIKIIILTAHNSASDRETSKTVGADAFMGKPYEYDQLLKQIRTLMGA